MIFQEFKSISNTIRKRGFSDRLYFLNFKLTWIFVFFCFVLDVVSGYLGISELAIISSGIPCAFAELGLHTAFIVWKAKVENCRKHHEDITFIQ